MRILERAIQEQRVDSIVKDHGSRRFTLLDAMILIGATAVGFAGARAGVWCVSSFYAFLNPDPRWLRFHTGEMYASAFLTVFSFALLAVACRGRLGNLRRSLQQPGTAACAVSAFTVLSLLLAKALWASANRALALHPAWWADIGSWGPHVGGAIAAAWLVLAGCGLWRRTSDWVEWAGRGVGAGWIAFGIIESVYRNAV
jgi:hypothetical protein